MRKETKYPPFYASNTYFSHLDVDTLPVSARQQTYQASTALKQNPGVTLLYFLDDHGSLIVNTDTYPVCSGLFILLGIYHYFQIVPDPEKGPMEIIQVRMNYHTFLFMAANPYYHFNHLNISSRPLFAKPDPQMEKLTVKTLKKLMAASANQKEKGPKDRLLLGMKIMGIFQKSMDYRSIDTE